VNEKANNSFNLNLSLKGGITMRGIVRNKKIVGASVWMILVPVLLFLSFPGASWAKSETVLRFASYFPTAAPQSKLLEKFCSDINKESKGKIKIEFFGGGSLLKATKVADGVVQGIADIGFSHVEYTRGRFPITEMLDLPLGFPSAWVGTHVANKFYKKFKPKEWNKFHVLWFNTCPPNVIILAKKPVYKMSDLKGLTIRGPGRVGDVLKRLGATPKPVPMNEIYEAMARGVVEGSMTPIETLRSFRLAEVAKYVTKSWQIGNVYTFYVVMNKKVWNRLSQSEKEIFNKVCQKYEEKSARIWNKVDLVGLKFGKKHGVKFIDLSPNEVTKWKRAVEPVSHSYVEELIAKGYSKSSLEKMLKYIRDQIKFWTQKQVQQGIKSVTGPKNIRLN